MNRPIHLALAAAALAAVTTPACAQGVSERDREVARASRTFTVCLGEAAKNNAAATDFEAAIAQACRPQEEGLLAAAAAVQGSPDIASIDEIRQAIAQQRQAILAENRRQVALR